MFPSLPPSSIPLLCFLVHGSLSCVRSFACHSCATQFPSSLPIYLSSSFLPDDSLSPVSPFITSAHCEFASCLSPPPHFFNCSAPSPCVTLPFPPWTWLCLFVSGLSVLLWFLPPLFAPPLLVLLFIYIERDGGRAVRVDWWMTRGHGWGDLGVWWTLLSVGILLKELACSLLWKGPWICGRLARYIKIFTSESFF